MTIDLGKSELSLAYNKVAELGAAYCSKALEVREESGQYDVDWVGRRCRNFERERARGSAGFSIDLDSRA